VVVVVVIVAIPGRGGGFHDAEGRKEGLSLLIQ
jgi:hypothetical protein